jgi:K+-sensing histidine kinase KdpD
MDQNIQLLFDRLNEGILLVSSNGVVLYANPAAEEIMPAVVGEMLSAEWLLNQISATQRGYLKLPQNFDVDLPRGDSSADHVQITLLASPARSNFIVVMKNVSAERQLANELGNLSEMIYCEVRAPLQRFLSSVAEMLTKFEQLSQENWTLRNAVTILSRRSDALLDRLQKVSLLAASSKMSTMRDEMRIPLPILVGDAVQAAKQVFAELGIRVSYCGLENGRPCIYGNRNFLAQALAGYLRYLAECSGRGANIVIAAESHGNQVNLSITNDAGLASASGTAAGYDMTAAEQPRAFETMNLTLVVCKRVVRLHGGNLRIVREAGITKAIVFEFPAGAPTAQNRQLETLQTLRYAQDLNTLMELLPHHFGESNMKRGR